MFLIVYWWEDFKQKKQIINIALIFPTLTFVAYFAFFATGKLDYYTNSDKYLLDTIKINHENKEIPIYYWQSKNYSGQFYTHGKAQMLETENQVDSVQTLHKKLFLVIATHKQVQISKQLDKMTLIKSNYKNSIFVSK